MRKINCFGIKRNCIYHLFRAAKRPIVPILIVVLLYFPLLAQGAYNPPNNLLGNPGFEAGATVWVAGGGGIAAVESCCGQHETPFWGRETSPYGSGSTPSFDSDTRDGYIEPNGQTTQMFQSQAVTAGQKYRISTWFWDNGMIGRLYFKSPSIGTTYCGASNGLFAPLSCEFTASANEQVSFGVEGNAGAGRWVVTDDWALTTLTQPAPNGAPKWTTLPVLYYGDSNSYQTRTDVAAASWNNAMGKQMLKRTTDINQAMIQVKGRNLGTINVPYGNWYAPFPPNRLYGTLEVNKDYLDVWKDPPYRFGFEAREGIIAHEFGHALGLKHVPSDNNCQLMQRFGHVQTWLCAVFKPTSSEVAAVRAIYP